MNINELKPINKLNPFTKFCCTIGNLPSSYLDSMTYYEQLLWFCNFLEKTVIPTLNTNAETVQELQNLFVELKNYVDNYFTNLDVQEEINNKLDEMAEDGVLESILLNYVNVTKVYNTTVEMLEDTNLKNGMKVKTLGYYEINDGGSSYYIIKEKNENYVIDGGSIIELNNNLVAILLITNDTINTAQFGFINDGISDNSSRFVNLIKFAIINNLKINFIFKANYYFDSFIDITTDIATLDDVLFIDFNNSTCIINNNITEWFQIHFLNKLTLINGNFTSNNDSLTYSSVNVLHFFRINNVILDNLYAENVNSLFKTDYFENRPELFIDRLLTTNITVKNAKLIGFFFNINNWVGDNFYAFSDDENKHIRELFYIRVKLFNVHLSNIKGLNLDRFVFHFNRYQNEEVLLVPPVNTPGFASKNLLFENIYATFADKSGTCVAHFDSDDNDITLNNVQAFDVKSLIGVTKRAQIKNIFIDGFEVNNGCQYLLALENDTFNINNLTLKNGSFNGEIFSNYIEGLIDNLSFINVNFNDTPSEDSATLSIYAKNTNNILFDNVNYYSNISNISRKQVIQTAKDIDCEVTIKNCNFSLNSEAYSFVHVPSSAIATTNLKLFNNFLNGTFRALYDNETEDPSNIQFNNFINNTIVS